MFIRLNEDEKKLAKAQAAALRAAVDLILSMEERNIYLGAARELDKKEIRKLLDARIIMGDMLDHLDGL